MTKINGFDANRIFCCRTFCTYRRSVTHQESQEHQEEVVKKRYSSAKLGVSSVVLLHQPLFASRPWKSAKTLPLIPLLTR